MLTFKEEIEGNDEEEKEVEMQLTDECTPMLMTIHIQWDPAITAPPFKGSPIIKVNVLRSQMIVFNVILPLFK